ncbi:kinase-like protein, partial [Stereum hirsutum FP-91666 SS1]|uniref:kinase-like protein n=1 Tax=Stereum hirsutum (strain FP-91666) TaxID=721885 RepID=UPI0004449C01
GWLHISILLPLSRLYCRSRPHLQRIASEGCVYPLPFNLILKSTERVREQEALATMLAQSMGIPVPRILSYGESDPNESWNWGSILMMRIPGEPLNEVFDSLSPDELATIKGELASHLERMRRYSNRWGTRICGVDGGDAYGARIPLRHIAAGVDEDAFHQSLFPFVNDSTAPNYAQRRAAAEGMPSLFPHAIVFTHGDLWHHNIMVHDGHITGIIDWEYAGWLPEYWEYTTIMRWTTFPWSKFLGSLPGYRYNRELESDSALARLSVDSCF